MHSDSSLLAVTSQQLGCVHPHPTNLGPPTNELAAPSNPHTLDRFLQFAFDNTAVVRRAQAQNFVFAFCWWHKQQKAQPKKKRKRKKEKRV